MVILKKTLHFRGSSSHFSLANFQGHLIIFISLFFIVVYIYIYIYIYIYRDDDDYYGNYNDNVMIMIVIMIKIVKNEKQMTVVYYI